MRRKKTITICSSTSFYKDIIELEKQLKGMGFKVKIPTTVRKMQKSGNFTVEYYKTWFKNKKDYKKKTQLMKGHFKKVIEGDAILAVNKEKNGIPGYIGGNLLMEMALAFHFGKSIYILHEIEEKHQFVEEILGLNPIFLDGDLTKMI